MDDNALTETAKLVFNITHFSPKTAALFTPSIPRLFSILTQSNENPPLRQPIASVLNALLNFDGTSTEWKSAAFPSKDLTSVSAKLVSLLDSSVKSYSDSDLNTLASPLIALLSKLGHSGPSEINAYFRDHLLPSSADRSQVLGRGDSLSSRLLRLSNSPTATTLGDSISNLLFELSDSDATKYVQNVGFGYASGFLMRKGIPLPSTTGVATDASGFEINPVTGQRKDREEESDLPEMTEEEKEREAERLFVLFER